MKEAHVALPYSANRSKHWQDLLNLMLAIWLFFSPWVLQFGQHVVAQPGAGITAVQAASSNAWVLGVIVFLVSATALYGMELWQEWVNLILGAWIFIAPWVLGFSPGLYDASWLHRIVGALIFAISAASLSQFGPRQLGPRQPEQVPR
jgi:hypothetical protein